MSDAEVWITGTYPNQQVNFKLPAGGPGPEGPEGPEGPAGPAGPTVPLDSLSDVTAPSPTDGQALVWDSGTSKWVNETPASTLNSLTDVDTTGVATGEVLSYDGAEWVPSDPGAAVTVSATEPVSPADGDIWFDIS